MEQLEIDDLDFYPCKCEYQICRFCWHRLLTDENGLCPACRQPYPEDPVTFKPLSCADVQRIKDEKRLKQQAEKLRISESRNHLANYRVLQKNLVYVVGLSARVADPDTLRKPEYFGRFGKILKVVVGTAPTANHPHAQPSHTAYVTYSKVEEALRAIQAVCNAQLDGRIVKASLGTTKYCSSFLRSQKCFKPECMYLHEIADSDISFTKEDMHMGKHAEYERRLIDTVLNRTAAHAQEKRSQTWTNKNNICWDQNGSETSEETDNTRDGGYNGGDESPSGDPTPSEAFGSRERRVSPQGKESASKVGKVNQAAPSSPHQTATVSTPQTSSLRESTPTTLDSKATESNHDPRASSPSKLVEQSSSINSIYNQDTESKLLRLLCASEDNGAGMVPAPAPVSEAPAPLVNWQTLLGLSPQATTGHNTSSSYASSTMNAQTSPQKSLVTSPPPGLGGFISDDDLGFDPFNESSKGLARLLEEEEKVKQPSIASYINQHFIMQQLHQQQQQQSLSLRDLWSRPSSLFPSVNAAQSPMPSPLDMFAGLMNGHLQSQQQQQHQQLHHQLHQPSNHHHAQQHHQSHQPQQHRQQFDPYCAPPPGLAPPQRTTTAPASLQSISDWQEGLKALLPNVNVRFVSDLESGNNLHHLHQQHSSAAAQHSASSFGSRWPPSAYGLDVTGRSNPHHVVPHTVPPPPGFSVPNR